GFIWFPRVPALFQLLQQNLWIIGSGDCLVGLVLCSRAYVPAGRSDQCGNRTCRSTPRPSRGKGGGSEESCVTRNRSVFAQVLATLSLSRAASNFPSTRMQLMEMIALVVCVFPPD